MIKNKITKDSILQAAIKISDKKGLTNLTLKDIALDLGIKPPSLYNHVSGIDDILSLIALKGLEELYNALSEASIGVAGRDAIVALSNAYRKFAVENPTLYSAAQNPKLWHSDMAIHCSNKIIMLLKKLLSIYQLDDTQCIHVIRALRSFLHGFSQLEYAKAFELKENLDESFQIGINLLLDGFKLA